MTCRPPSMIDSPACVSVAGLRHLASPRPPGAECGSGERLCVCCRLGFRLWTPLPDSSSRRSLITITSPFNRFRTAPEPLGDRRWLDGYRRVLSTAAQGKQLTSGRRALKAEARVSPAAGRRLGTVSVSGGGSGSGGVCVFVSLCVYATLRANMLS